MASNPPPAPAIPHWRQFSTVAAAALLLALYLYASWYLMGHFTGTNAQGVPVVGELGWSRALVVYNGIASIGFAAAGVLLGTTVQQVNLAAAKADAAKKGAALKDALDKATTPPPAASGSDVGGAGPVVRLEAVRQALINGLS